MNQAQKSGKRDLFVSAVEINEHHGVGILLRRYFGEGTGAVTLRSRTGYGGREAFGESHLALDSRFLTEAETEVELRRQLGALSIGRILAVPYYREDFIHARLAQKITGAPLCVFLMDDQNVFAREVPDRCLASLLKVADLRLGISPELCEAYRMKFGHPLGLMPPVLPPGPEPIPNHWSGDTHQVPFTCAMIGNVWTRRKLDTLRSTIRGAGLRVHWYGKGAEAHWHGLKPGELEADSIETLGYWPEPALARVLSSYPLVLVPSGTLDGEDDNPAFSYLSLPSRVLFLASRCQVPILVLGHGNTAAGRFVRRLRIGNCAGYSPEALWNGIRLLTDPKRHRRQCANLGKVAKRLTHPDPGQWLWNSLEKRKPLKAPWEPLFRPRRSWYGKGLETKMPFALSPYVKPSDNQNQTDKTSPEAALQTLFTRSSLFGPQADALANAELGQVNRSLVLNLAIQASPKPGDWLWIGEAPRDSLAGLPKGVRLWESAQLSPQALATATRIDLEAFPRATPAVPTDFDVILSDRLADGLAQEPLELYEKIDLNLQSLLKAKGLQVHAFTAILHRDYFWVHPLFHYLGGRVPLDTLLSSQDLWTMSEETYLHHWQPHTGRTFKEFGRALGLFLLKART